MRWPFGPRRDPVFLASHWRCNEPVAGTPFNQPALYRLDTILGADREDRHAMALLEPEPSNPHDRNAVRVIVENLPIGHLSRESADEFHGDLRHLGLTGQPVACRIYLDKISSEGLFWAHLGIVWPLEIAVGETDRARRG